MRNADLFFSALCIAIPVSIGSIGCSDGANDFDDSVKSSEEESASEGNEPIGQVTSELVATDTVATLIASNECGTASLRGLSIQLVEELNCLAPNTMGKIDNLPNVQLGSGALPFLQTSVIEELKKVVAARGGAKLNINSSLRSLPQQYTLFQWGQQKRCRISVVADPGTSNHESGRAVDVQETAAWRSSFLNNGWKWQGPSDDVHYEFNGGGVNIRGLSVKAFQQLWNRNHPEDKIAEDGAYGPATAARISKSPIGGFPIGAMCPADAGAADSGAPPTDLPPIVVPSGDDDEAATPTPAPDGGATTNAFAFPEAESGGCSSTGGGAGSAMGGIGGMVAMALLISRRRRQS